jgi:NAD(P)H-hydrate repair Nnr-like enzyme with NAD(P)H-hydrate dehydratase domain
VHIINVQKHYALLQEVPMVIDADGLKVVCNHLDCVKGYKRVVLTPNAPELWSLADALGVKHAKKPPHEDSQMVQVR